MVLSAQSQYVSTEIRQDGVAIISYNRPQVANALNVDVMKELFDAYTRVLADDKVRVLVQTGKGSFFSAGTFPSDPSRARGDVANVDNPSWHQGMDLSGQRPAHADVDPPALLHAVNKMLIDCDKVTIAAVNGPGVGYGTSSLGLFDLVYAVPDAYFFTPFVKWGLAAEACSSFTFTHALGRQKAAHLILTGERMTAQELESAGLISKIFPAENFLETVLAIAQRVAKLPPISSKANKSLMTSYFKDQLHRANDLERELFAKLAAGSETKEAVKKFAKEQRAKKARSAKREHL
ncbi:hypothetical protein PV08_03418 [Exophiala spinifera]|uniref:Enoyl-CoA hydratase n=1 Tax=Exophiala spinifera TaxID=91928 RepID=A0A0D1YV20_9EURO|nr:uncharacterized protein PV08_03418 [Exophiala spinifera]KIW19126.1 hypothetical protein PV08_03418 [Exophiala spinifera]